MVTVKKDRLEIQLETPTPVDTWRRLLESGPIIIQLLIKDDAPRTPKEREAINNLIFIHQALLPEEQQLEK